MNSLFCIDLASLGQFYNIYYLHRRKEVMFYLCLSACLSARLLKNFWTDFDEYFGGVGRDPRNNRLDFDGGPDHDPDPEFFKKDSLFTIASPIDRQE